MKKIFLYSAVAAVVSLCSAACVGDLDTQPLDPTVKTADQIFSEPESYSQYVNYAYGYFALVSQGSHNDADIAVGNAGQSEFVRQYMILNELTAGSLLCPWTDDYVTGLQYGSWSVDNTAAYAVYVRGLKGATICNQFLDSSVSSDEAVERRGHSSVLGDVRNYRSEMRALRAFYYLVLLDMFGNPPLALPENIASTPYPKQVGRAGLFNWLENELLELTADENLPAVRVQYPRLSKGAAWAMLARLYLNAEVYTGTPRWEDAKNAAEKVIKEGGYELCPVYVNLFRQDNTESGAVNEFIVAAMYDDKTIKSWGGTTHLVYSVVDGKDISGEEGSGGKLMQEDISEKYGFTVNIYNNQWNGYHVSDEFVMENFELQGVTWEGTEGFGYDVDASDKRAAFYNRGFQQKIVNEGLSIRSGWTCLKWLPITSDHRANLVEDGIDLSSADFPLIRLAEMYIIYAEAEARQNGGNLGNSTQGWIYLNTIYRRANDKDIPSSVDLDWILKERVREFMWEGHRRTDLIRYNKFTGSAYTWPYKGGIANGGSIAEFRTVFPIPTQEFSANPSLQQNPGY
ncbi:MAG: RagB/SusD family nutrient uptake outer membrane protein [Alistipes sp.]|nr:RagB/SusD family nutrient uptake outer membrane protein [Alistipes sp.]